LSTSLCVPDRTLENSEINDLIFFPVVAATAFELTNQTGSGSLLCAQWRTESWLTNRCGYFRFSDEKIKKNPDRQMEKRFHQYHVHSNNAVYDYLPDDDHDDDDDAIVHNFELRLHTIFLSTH